MKLDQYRLAIRDPTRRMLTIAAVVFAGLFLVGTAGYAIAGLSSYPSPLSATTAEVERYFRDTRDATRLNALVQLAATVPLLAYGAIAGNRLRAIGDRSAAPVIAVAAATLSAACLALAAIGQWALSRPHTLQEGGTLLRALQDLAFMAGGPAHVVSLGALVAAVSVSASASRCLPRWIVALGGLVAILSALSILTLYFDVAAWLLPVARFPSFVWLLVTAIALPATTRLGDRRRVAHVLGDGPPDAQSRPPRPAPVGAGRSPGINEAS
jgi:hypothetical protein